MKPLNYAFARERGVALQTGEAPVFLLREDADPLALVEARRAAGQACEVRLLEARAFDRALSEIYAFDGLAHSMSDSAEDEAGESLSDIINDIPKTADLLDSASDAPIIRLINGLIAEAVRGLVWRHAVRTWPRMLRALAGRVGDDRRVRYIFGGSCRETGRLR